MNNELRLYHFGCSFTALESTLFGQIFKNYRNIVAEKLGVATGHSEALSGKSNQHIFNDVYEIASKLEINPEIDYYFIIQTTFINRIGMYCDISPYKHKFVSMCKTENPDSFFDKTLINFYNDWLKYFYGRNESLKELKKMIDFVSAYLENKNIKFIYIGIDDSLDLIDDESFFQRNNFLKFEKTYSYYQYAIENKLRIADLDIDSKIKDYHFNKKGHEVLGSSIVNKIKLKTNII